MSREVRASGFRSSFIRSSTKKLTGEARQCAATDPTAYSEGMTSPVSTCTRTAYSVKAS